MSLKAVTLAILGMLTLCAAVWRRVLHHISHDFVRSLLHAVCCVVTCDSAACKVKCRVYTQLPH
jgi:hypothetical protein